MTSPGSALPAGTEWLEQARAHDRDRYISALLAPAARRDDLLALQAFDAEMARIPHAVSEPLLAEIRLQWWRDALAPLLSAPRSSRHGHAATGHPLADALMDLATSRRLSPAPIHGLIDARSTELSDAPLTDADQLTAYVDKTDTAFVALTAALLSPSTSEPEVDRWTRPVGRALGYTRLARRLAHRDPLADMLVPLSIWPLDARHSHANEPATEARTHAAREQAIRQLLDMAEAHFALVPSALADLPRALRSAVLPVVLVPRYVAHLRRSLAAMPSLPPDIGPLSRVWTLWRARHKSRLP